MGMGNLEVLAEMEMWAFWNFWASFNGLFTEVLSLRKAKAEMERRDGKNLDMLKIQEWEVRFQKEEEYTLFGSHNQNVIQL